VSISEIAGDEDEGETETEHEDNEGETELEDNEAERETEAEDEDDGVEGPFAHGQHVIFGTGQAGRPGGVGS